MMNQTIDELLEMYKEEILHENKSIVVALKNGVCTIEKGTSEVPFSIKVDHFDMQIPLTIDEFLLK